MFDSLDWNRFEGDVDVDGGQGQGDADWGQGEVFRDIADVVLCKSLGSSTWMWGKRLLFDLDEEEDTGEGCAALHALHSTRSTS